MKKAKSKNVLNLLYYMFIAYFIIILDHKYNYKHFLLYSYTSDQVAVKTTKTVHYVIHQYHIADSTMNYYFLSCYSSILSCRYSYTTLNSVLHFTDLVMLLIVLGSLRCFPGQRDLVLASSLARAFIFPATILQAPVLWPFRVGELSGSDP